MIPWGRPRSHNLLVQSPGRWRVAGLLDPNCKFAHAEAEIAYLELFHTCTPTFMKAYQSHHKLSGDYHKFRKPIYQLYPMINHLNLFGESYLKPLTAAVGYMAKLSVILRSMARGSTRSRLLMHRPAMRRELPAGLGRPARVPGSRSRSTRSSAAW